MSAVLEQADSREPDVLFRVVNHVAIITLNRPASLNALSHSMIHELAEFVERCRVDDDIVALVLRGAGQKSFCAGGDVRALYEMRRRNGDRWQSFFIDEYCLDYSLYRFPKPVIALLDGIVMGGGMGLGQGAWLRIVTDRTKMAMPETRIGLVPDVGATHFLGQMPTETELYVGLTGVTLSGAEALHFGLADLCVPCEWLASFEERLMRIVTADASAIDLMRGLRTVFEPPCNIVPHAGLAVFAPLIKRHFDRRLNIERIVASVRHDLDRDPPREIRQWLQTTHDALTSHSPTMLHVTHEALLRGRQMTLAECFRMELGIITRAIDDGDFCEGVRAHLIDKDRKPGWAPATLAEVRPERVLHFLSSPWRPASHPLAGLGTE